MSQMNSDFSNSQAQMLEDKNVDLNEKRTIISKHIEMYAKPFTEKFRRQKNENKLRKQTKFYRTARETFNNIKLDNGFDGLRALIEH